MARIGKVTEAIISGMKYDREHGMSVKEVMEKYRVSKATVTNYAPMHSHTKLTDEQREEIIRLLDSGVDFRVLAEKMGLNPTTVYNYTEKRRNKPHNRKERNGQAEQTTLLLPATPATAAEQVTNELPELPAEIVSIVGRRMELLEADIKELKGKLFELEKEHFSLEQWLNKNGVDTSVV